MSKWQDKPTPKERRYTILILFITTLTVALLLFIMFQATPYSTGPIYLSIGVALMFFFPAACYIGVSRHRENIYSLTGGYLCVVIIVVIFAIAVLSYFTRTS